MDDHTEFKNTRIQYYPGADDGVLKHHVMMMIMMIKHHVMMMIMMIKQTEVRKRKPTYVSTSTNICMSVHA
jgi:hypothetical protein